MKLSYLKAGLYRGEVKEYNVKTSDRTGKTYLNLNLDINAWLKVFWKGYGKTRKVQ